MNNWFVFFVQTGSEEIVRKYLNNMLDPEESVSFVPQIELIFKKSNLLSIKYKPMFPGYVFAETSSSTKEFAIQTTQLVRNSKHIIKLLGNESPDFMALNTHEKEFLLKFCDNKYVFEKSLGLIKGDKVYVTSGPLMGRESIIKRIDRHRKCAEIELMFMGDLRRVIVSLEIVSKM